MRHKLRSQSLKISEITPNIDFSTLGSQMHRLVEDLYPLCRSITGDGLRETLHRVQKIIPLNIHEVPTGTPVLDWTVPREWNIRDAYIKNSHGEKVVDFKKSNLHVVGYSIPVHQKMSLDELRPHLISLPKHPDWIPYRTNYYKETWGFCLSHRQYQALLPGEYEVVIDSTLKEGSLTYGEFYHSGRTSEEVLISCHVCHPSLCNDNLSSLAVVANLAHLIKSASTHYSYRFLFIPGTIGSITWLALNRENVSKIRHGLVVAGIGDSGPLTYKRSRQGNAEIDQVAQQVLDGCRVMDFIPYGYDERQYCSPGFNLPIGCLMRTPFGEYPEYHTSADNCSFVKQDKLADTLRACWAIFATLEANRYYRNLCPYGEPQLGRRGLFDQVGGAQHDKSDQMALLWVLNLADGEHSLLDISKRSGLDFSVVQRATDRLMHANLLEPMAK